LSGENEDFNEAFRETNYYFNHGVPNVSYAGGAAIWLADYVLSVLPLVLMRCIFMRDSGLHTTWQVTPI
jgi:trehalose-6-phosphate synthase